MARASADVGFMLIAYNLRRLINIIGQNELKKYLEQIATAFLAIISQIELKLVILRHSICVRINSTHVSRMSDYALY